MIGMLGKVFGADKAIKSVVDGGMDMIDKAFYTEQEKAEDRAAAVAKRDAAKGELVQLAMSWMESSKGQNLARRVIALIIIGMWALVWFTSVMMRMIGAFVTDQVMHLQIADASSGLSDSAAELTAPVMLILGFYFAAPHLEKFVTPIAERIRKREK